MATTKPQEVRLVWRRIDRIPPHPKNPKAHDVPGIVASIQRFGFRGAIVFNGVKVTSEGHGRTKALRQLYDADPSDVPKGIRKAGKRDGGMWTAPCLVGMTFSNAAEERAFLVASNELTIRGGYDEQALTEILSEAQAQPMGLDGLGFTEMDLAELLQRFAPDDGSFPPLDDTPSPFEQMAFVLSRAQAEAVRQALDASKAQGAFADPSNQNPNGNAIARICDAYLKAQSDAAE